MRPIELKRRLEQRLTRPEWRFAYDMDQDQLRVEHIELKKGVTLSLNQLITKYKEKEEQLLDETVAYVEVAMAAVTDTVTIIGNEKHIYPVIRSTSFPLETKDGKELVYEDHTAETRIYFAINREKTYTLITKEMILEEKLDDKRLKEIALFNIRSLSNPLKKDVVAGNTFYFINTKDGYDASRILNDAFLKKMYEGITGDMAIAVPHQDVLIISDIKNEKGYDILAQLVFQFFSSGTVPITALPFMYEEGELEPIFILAQRKPEN